MSPCISPRKTCKGIAINARYTPNFNASFALGEESPRRILYAEIPEIKNELDKYRLSKSNESLIKLFEISDYFREFVVVSLKRFSAQIWVRNDQNIFLFNFREQLLGTLSAQMIALQETKEELDKVRGD